MDDGRPDTANSNDTVGQMRRSRSAAVRQALTFVGLLGLVGGVVVEVLARLGRLHPLLELASNLRPHILIGSVGVLLLLILARHKAAWIAAGLVVLGVLQMAPFWFATPDDPIAGGTDFAVMQFNIAESNRNFDEIAQRVVASDPDVLVITELTTVQWANISSRLTQYAFTIAEPWDDQEQHLGGGLAILSKTEVAEVSLPVDVSPPHRAILAGLVAVQNEQVLVVAMHPHASRTEATKVDLRQAQLEAVSELMAERGGHSIVAGDLNLAPTSTQYRSFLDDLGWRDPHRSVGWNATWNFRGLLLGLPVDHVLVSREIALLAYDVGDGAGSDHRTVTARLSLPPA